MTPRNRHRLPVAVLLVLVTVPVAFVVVGAIGSTLAQSLGLLPLVGQAALDGDAYAAAAGDLPMAIATSLAIAATSTTLAALIGTTAGILITAGNRTGRLVAAIGAGVVTVPHLIAAASMGLLLSDAGILARLLGVEQSAWPALVGGPWWAAVVLEYAWKESAFIALVVAGTLASRVARFDETAALLGARRTTRLRLVLLPLAAPSIVISSTIVFVYTLGSYEVAWLLGRTSPEPLAVLAVRLYSSASLSSRPEAAAVATVTVALSALVAAGAFALLRRTAVWR